MNSNRNHLYSNLLESFEKSQDFHSTTSDRFKKEMEVIQGQYNATKSNYDVSSSLLF